MVSQKFNAFNLSTAETQIRHKVQKKVDLGMYIIWQEGNIKVYIQPQAQV